MMGSARRVAATVMASVLLAGTALAQPTSPPTDAEKRQAGDLTKKAIARSQAGDHATAIELYLEAYAIVPLPVLLSNVGAEYQKLAKPVESLKYFCMYLDKDPTGPSASYATAQAKTLQIELGNADVTDADVCTPRTPPAPEPSTTPAPTTAAPTPTPTPPPADGGGGLRLTGLALGGAGVIALGVGVYFGLQAQDISDQISNHPMNEEWPADIRELEERGQAHENKQIIFLAAGGALAVTGTVLYVVGRARKSKGRERAVAVTPALVPGGMGLAVGGGF